MVSGFPDSVKALVAERCRGQCEACGAAPAVDTHHRRPRAAGGSKRADTNLASNALALCRQCHNVAENNRNLATTLGWLVPQTASPEAQPVIRRGEQVFLLPDGMMRYPDEQPPGYRGYPLESRIQTRKGVAR